MTKVWVVIIGTRAQLVKMAPVMLAAQEDGHHVHVIITGQHKDTMVDLAEDLGVLHLMPIDHAGSEKSTILKLLTWAPVALFRCYSMIGRIAKDSCVEWVLVHGDTASTFIGALAAKFKGCRVAHIESGLSSHKILNPFPEEIIRRLVSRIAYASLCPDADSAGRMKEIGVALVVNTKGNTIIDVLKKAIEKNKNNSPVSEKSIVVSLHRFENIMSSSRLEYLVNTICALSDYFNIYFIMHPPTYKRLISTGLLDKLSAHKGIVLQPRMNYTKFITLVSGAEVVLTDGGSNQEELAFLGIPTILMRDYSERPDGLGGNIVFESAPGMNLVAYLESGKYLGLKKKRVPGYDKSPSELIVSSLTANTKCQSSPFQRCGDAVEQVHTDQ